MCMRNLCVRLRVCLSLAAFRWTEWRMLGAVYARALTYILYTFAHRLLPCCCRCCCCYRCAKIERKSHVPQSLIKLTDWKVSENSSFPFILPRNRFLQDCGGTQSRGQRYRNLADTCDLVPKWRLHRHRDRARRMRRQRSWCWET